MKIYIIIRHVQYEFDDVWGIYSSKKEVEKVIKLLKKKLDGGDELTVEEWDLNTNILQK